MKRNLRTDRLVWTAAFVALAAMGGCAKEPAAQPLTGDAFVRNRAGRDLGNPVDQPGALAVEGSRERKPDAAVVEPDPGNRTIKPAVAGTIRTPEEAATRPDLGGVQTINLPSTAPSTVKPTTLPTLEPGKWLTLGAILMEVNGRGIFTEKVLNTLEPAFSAEAKKRDPNQFRELAKALIDNQVRLYKREELEFASAQRSLDAQDDQLARAVTVSWRQKQITAAGGSLEMAKRKAAETGWDFDDLVEQQYRLHMIQIYYQKRIFPHVQVTAADVRNYYNTNKQTEFTQQAAVKLRVIKIDPKKYPGLKEEAIAKGNDLRKRAIEGTDFASLASTMNDDPRLAKSGGFVVKEGWLSQGAYAVEAVDKAAFQLKQGEVSDLISGPDGTIYLVRADEVKVGGTQAFEDLAVQERIRDKLKAVQFQALREKHVTDLEKDAITRVNGPAIDDALSIVMRRYPQWASAQ